MSSKHAMPIIVLNLGGEMMYILHQRLQAQSISEEKAKKVLLDVGRAMFSDLFVSELLKAQDIYSTSSTKQIFEKLAHSSIMRLNKSSMDKLFDLMTMGLKYQMLQCSAPQQYLHVTLHHLEAIIALVGSSVLTDMVNGTIAQLTKLYSTFTHGMWMRLNHTLMRFVQGRRVKVSLFLQHSMQTSEGTIIVDGRGRLPYGTEQPGMVRFLEGGKVIASRNFTTDSKAEHSEHGQLLQTDSILGTNMYSKDFKADVKVGRVIPSTVRAMEAMAASGLSGPDFRAQTKGPQRWSPAAAGSVPSITSTSAKAELNMLADLLGLGLPESSPSSSAKGDPSASPGTGGPAPFKINLFPESSFDTKGGDSKDGEDGSSGMIMLDIDGAADAKSLQSYLEQLDFNDEPKAAAGGSSRLGHAGNSHDSDAKGGAIDDDDDDLLALMDSAK